MNGGKDKNDGNGNGNGDDDDDQSGYKKDSHGTWQRGIAKPDDEIEMTDEWADVDDIDKIAERAEREAWEDVMARNMSVTSLVIKDEDDMDIFAERFGSISSVATRRFRITQRPISVEICTTPEVLKRLGALMIATSKLENGELDSIIR